MYRDDTCAVCGDSLPPDHFYCREHATTVDDRLHEIGRLLPRVARDSARLAQLLEQIAEETWDYLADQEPGDPVWPPAPPLILRADADEITVDVDSEPGYVQVEIRSAVARTLAAVGSALADTELQRLAGAASATQGANATH